MNNSTEVLLQTEGHHLHLVMRVKNTDVLQYAISKHLVDEKLQITRYFFTVLIYIGFSSIATII